MANLAAANCYKKDHFDSPAIQEVVSKVEYIYITVRHPCHLEASGRRLGATDQRLTEFRSHVVDRRVSS